VQPLLQFKSNSVCLYPEVYRLQCACAILLAMACPAVQHCLYTEVYKLQCACAILSAVACPALQHCLYPKVYKLQCACAILSAVACPALQHFPTLSHKGIFFRGKKNHGTENMCFDFLYNFYLEHLSF